MCLGNSEIRIDGRHSLSAILDGTPLALFAKNIKEKPSVDKNQSCSLGLFCFTILIPLKKIQVTLCGQESTAVRLC